MYKMFIDDVRTPPQGDWVVVRSSEEALAYIVNNGMPSFISFDHDLGGDDTSIVFLSRLVGQVWDGLAVPPAYEVHSANPVGAANIRSFMDSWYRSIDWKGRPLGGSLDTL
jgi:hypothetical protein